MLDSVSVVTDLIPEDQPRYFMGLGDPVGLVNVVERGIDMFDCVLPTRLARHGTVLTSGGFVVEGEDIIFDNNKNYIKSKKPANIQDIEKNQIYF